MTTTTSPEDLPPAERKLPPVLGRLLSGTFWLALRTPLQAIFALWTLPLTVRAIGASMSGAYGFAWNFGFFQMLFELGMSSALQAQVSESYTKGDRQGVDRAITCGMNFYATMALVQIAALLSVAYIGLPFSEYWGNPAQVEFIVKLLWLQAFTAPCYGLSVVVSSVLQAARRYDFVPRFELAVIVLRFAVLWVGVHAKIDYFLIVIVQTIVQVGLSLGPALWVMIRELGHFPRFQGARRDDYRALVHISLYVFMIQLSVVFADKLDTIILAFALKDPGEATAIYLMVSKPFLQIRQTGWTLAYMVMPAVASLMAVRDNRAIDRLKYDGTRLLVAAIFPVALLAWIYAGPFLSLWMGNTLGHDAGEHAGLLRLFLVATFPLVLSVGTQIAIGMGKPRVIALSALAGSLVNLPLSYYLTLRVGVAGVIWGTVLTTLFSNLLIPGVYLARLLEIRARRFLVQTLAAPAAGGASLIAATALFQAVYPLKAHTTSLLPWMPLVIHLTVGCLSYAVGYLALPAGRADVIEVVGKLWRQNSRAD